MSRRTKLILTTLFLVLLAIPVVYVAFTWRPENPLRFQLAAPLPEIPTPQLHLRDAIFNQEVLVENTSGATINLHMSRAIEATGPVIHAMEGAKSDIYSVVQDRSRRTLIIGPYQTVRTTVLIRTPEVQLIRSRISGTATDTSAPVHVLYGWTSSSKDRFNRACQYLHEHLPDTLTRFIPSASIWGSHTLLSPQPLSNDKTNKAGG